MLMGHIEPEFVSEDVIYPEPARAISHPRTQNKGPMMQYIGPISILFCMMVTSA